MKDIVQEQFVELRRKQILEAASKVFAAKGFHPTTIRDIAKEAGVADGTIYNYFENKTSLLFGILDLLTSAAQQEAALLNMDNVDLKTYITTFIRLPLNVLRTDNFGLFRVVVSEIMVNPELRAEYYRRFYEPTINSAAPLFQKWAEENAIASVDIGLTIRVVSGLMLGVILQFLMGDETLEKQWDTLPDFLTEMILNGLKSTSTYSSHP